MALPALIRKTSDSLLVLLALMLPVHDQTVAIIAILLSFCWLTWVIFTPRAEVWQGWRKNYILLLFAGLYVLYILGLSISADLKEGFQNLQGKLPLLFFPVFFATSGLFQLNEKKWNMITGAFITGCLAMSMFYFFHALYRYVLTHAGREFYYIQLLNNKHPSYFAMYMSLCIGMIMFHVMDKKRQKKYQQILALILVLWFQVFIFLLSSKAGIISLAMVILISSGYLLLVKKKYFTGLGLLVVWGGLFVSFLYVFTITFDRFREVSQVLKETDKIPPETLGSTGSRILIWKTSAYLLKNHPLTGLGTGDVKDALVEEYQKMGFSYGVFRRLNAHDQFLETSLAVGLAGLIILLSYMILPWIMCLRKREGIYLLFLSVIFINFLFESMLERQAGVVFYAFFNAFLYKKLSDTSGESDSLEQGIKIIHPPGG